ncbi:hypothetical protein [Actinoplanes sp. NPDC026670]|uniref:hypothetical protein n=1 Tax=Actinoplanes sp. NPDC026670 TaxID=3154700 RepID=UPI0033F7AEB4
MAGPGRRLRRRHRPHPTCPACSGQLDADLVAARDQAIAAVTTALSRLGDPAGAALDAIGGEEFTSLVWQTPKLERTRFLTDLGVPPARRPTAVAARMGLAKLRRWPVPEQARAGRFLTNITATGLEKAWQDAAVDGQDPEDALRLALTGDPAHANVMRLTVISHGHSSWAMTTALRLGLAHGLALPDWPAAALDDITAACRRLEEVWPVIAQALNHDDPDSEHDEDHDTGHTPLPVESGESATEGSTTVSLVTPAPGPASGTPTQPLPPPGSGPGNEPADDGPIIAAQLTAAAAALNAHQEAARRSATLLTETLHRGEVPDPGLLTPVTVFIATAHELYDLLGRAGRTVPETATVEDLLAAAVTVNGRRSAIAALAGLTGPDTESGRVAAAVALAAALTAAAAWTEQQQQHANGLLALADLISAVAAKDLPNLPAALAAVEDNLPDDLAPLKFAALLGQLNVEPITTGDGTDPASEDTEPTETTPVPADEDKTGASPAGRVLALPQGTIATAGPDQTAPVPGGPVPAASIPVAPVVVGPPPAPDQPEDADAPQVHDGGDTLAAVCGDTPADAVAGRALVRLLLGQGRLSLAFHAAAACGFHRRADALRILALSDAVRTETSPTAGMLRSALETEQSSPPSGDLAVQLLLLAGAVRACLVTADAASGESVLALTRMMPQLPALTALATTIGTASAHGWLYSPAVLAALAPIAGADNDIAATVDAAQYHRDRRRTMEFVRANTIADLWWAPNGVIGRMLDAAAHDRRTDIETVAEELRRFAKRQYLDDLLAREDAALRASSSRPLQGQARRKLKEMAETSVAAVRDWVTAVRANQQAGSEPVPAHLTTLRTTVLAQWPAAEQELTGTAAEAAGMLQADAAHACRDSLQRSVAMLNGDRPAGPDRGPDAVLHQDLLRCAALPLHRDGTPARTVTFDDVTIAAATGWEDAFTARLAAEEYTTAGLIADSITDMSLARAMRDQLAAAAAHTRTDLIALHRAVTAETARAARLGQLDETASSTVSSLLAAGDVTRLPASPDNHNLGALRTHLLDVRTLLPQYLREAQDTLHKRVDNEVPDRHDTALVTAIHDRIDAGDLATAEEYLLAALHGEAPPTAEPATDLHEFLQLIDLMPAGITRELITTIREADSFAGLDLTVLSPTRRTAAADGLQAWVELRETRHHKVQKSALAAVLRLAGIEFGPLRPLTDPPAVSRRAWWDLTGVRRIGDTLVPQFGSAAGDRQRIMLCWGDADVRALFGWIAQDPGTHQPVIVLMLAPMTAGQRTDLALRCAKLSEKPVIVLDDIALTHLALRGGDQFTATARALLPFAATNPYAPEGLAALPSEMFYGRRLERSKIIDANGPNLLYGGRQLGKTALLQDAARTFERVPNQIAIYVPLPNGIGNTFDPLALWDKVAEKLTERKILPPKKDPRNPVRNVTAAVTAWLDEDPTRRMLLLIDECDGFFDADAETGFRNVTELRDLRDRHDRRFKPVFAGLHQVQRFASLPNQPLAGAHLGEQIAIGPLGPEPAYQLLFTPMETLGIRFTADDLIHRVLAYCNYQPKLLQLVGQALVASALSRRHHGPHYEISEADLDQVIGSEDLQRRVHDTVHLTLNLDSRYKLIALVVAFAALENGADHTLSTSTLREECQSWWPEGFAGQGADEFRSLLEEMRDLGVLTVTTGRQWRLRSTNVLRLLGTAHEIWEQLCSPQWRTTITKLSAKQARDRLDGLISPCTDQQLSRLVSRGSTVQIVVGTPATGAERVREALRHARDRSGARFELLTPGNLAAYKTQLRGGDPGGVHRVVLSPLLHRPDALSDSIVKAVQIPAAAGATRTVVLVVDGTDPGILDALTGPSLPVSADDVMPLRRASAVGLRSWLSANDRLEPFNDPGSHPDLMTATGGWPLLLDRATRLAQELSRPRPICERLTGWLSTTEGAAELVEATGLRIDPRAEAAFGHLVDYADPVTTDDLVEWCAEAGADPQRTARILQLLDVLVQSETDGMWTPEPVLTRAWQLLQKTA